MDISQGIPNPLPIGFNQPGGAQPQIQEASGELHRVNPPKPPFSDRTSKLAALLPSPVPVCKTAFSAYLQCRWWQGGERSRILARSTFRCSFPLPFTLKGKLRVLYIPFFEIIFMKQNARPGYVLWFAEQVEGKLKLNGLLDVALMGSRVKP